MRFFPLRASRCALNELLQGRSSRRVLVLHTGRGSVAIWPCSHADFPLMTGQNPTRSLNGHSNGQHSEGPRTVRPPYPGGDESSLYRYAETQHDDFTWISIDMVVIPSHTSRSDATRRGTPDALPPHTPALPHTTHAQRGTYQHVGTCTQPVQTYTHTFTHTRTHLHLQRHIHGHTHIDIDMQVLSKVVPVFRAHAEGSWFAEPWYTFEGDGDQLSKLRQEDVRH